MSDFDMLSAAQADSNGVFGEEDPVAAFLVQQENALAGIESDEGFSILDSGEVPGSLTDDQDDIIEGTVNGRLNEESNGPKDAYTFISTADRPQVEPESLRKWRMEQQGRLELLDANSRKEEAELKEKAKLELEEWHACQKEQLEKNKANNRAAEEAMLLDMDETSTSIEWENVARLCDFNPKVNKLAKDVSRMRSVLISLKQMPLVR